MSIFCTKPLYANEAINRIRRSARAESSQTFLFPGVHVEPDCIVGDEGANGLLFLPRQGALLISFMFIFRALNALSIARRRK